MSDYLIKGAIANAVNMASVSAEEAPILKPYMTLGGLLGKFLGQVQADGATGIVIELDGKAANLNPKPIVAATLAGLLGPFMESVNMVNAAAVASSNGIAVSTIRHIDNVIMRPCLGSLSPTRVVSAPLQVRWWVAISHVSSKSSISLLSS